MFEPLPCPAPWWKKCVLCVDDPHGPLMLAIASTLAGLAAPADPSCLAQCPKKSAIAGAWALSWLIVVATITAALSYWAQAQTNLYPAFTNFPPALVSRFWQASACSTAPAALRLIEHHCATSDTSTAVPAGSSATRAATTSAAASIADASRSCRVTCPCSVCWRRFCSAVRPLAAIKEAKHSLHVARSDTSGAGSAAGRHGLVPDLAVCLAFEPSPGDCPAAEHQRGPPVAQHPVGAEHGQRDQGGPDGCECLGNERGGHQGADRMTAQVMHVRAGPPEDHRLVMRGQRRVDHLGGNEAGQVEPRDRVRGEDRPRYGPAVRQD